MAETSSLLRSHTGNCIAGSNPALSAIFKKAPQCGAFFVLFPLALLLRSIGFPNSA
uniref:Uncharacterized protein n=1 Tax=Alcanivorax borkumensis (strain ATCC 700651 / DSM 11573 / NCIMB 13689 / SK2) TaxID=393595 RepID=Q0VNK5_ALCBS|nr:Hypothetical protein ABO_1795 [Alcanivorax borkumensis SK2]